MSVVYEDNEWKFADRIIRLSAEKHELYSSFRNPMVNFTTKTLNVSGSLNK